MKEGDIGVIDMRQPDGSVKTRPVLLLKKVKPFNDWIVCAISTQLQQEVNGFDMIIDSADGSFASTGLKQSSIIRLGMISTVSKTVIPGIIGSIQPNDLITLQKRLAALLVR